MPATIEVPTAAGLTSVSAKIGAYPMSKAGDKQPLKPGTKYVYFIVQQAGENDQATTVNEYSDADLTNWVAGTGKPDGERLRQRDGRELQERLSGVGERHR